MSASDPATTHSGNASDTRNDAVAATQPLATGVHLVGSIPLADTASVFQAISKTLAGHIHSIPDGETGKRSNFIRWQIESFPYYPHLVWRPDSPDDKWEDHTPTESDLWKLTESLSSEDAAGDKIETQYDTYAIASYKEFELLQADGAIPANVKFQVCLPSPLSALMRIFRPYQETVEPFYRDALLRALRRIQHAIPHDKLVIQWDCPREMSMIEGVGAYAFDGPNVKPWFEDVRHGLRDRYFRLLDAVADDVEVGIHLCYGDIGREHFMQPKDMDKLVEMANEIADVSKKPLAYLHMPVPKSRDYEAYFEPLMKLRLPKETKLYLGLIHANDLDGTKRRLAMARKILGSEMDLGVAAECGLGRAPPEDLPSIMEISRAVAGPLDK